MFGWYRNRAARERLARHVHSGCYEFCYLAEGAQVFGLGGKDYVLRPGDVFLTFPDEEHGSAGHPMERGSLHWFHLRVPPVGHGALGLGSEETARLFAALAALPTRCFPAGDAVGLPLAAAFAAAQDGTADPLRAVRIGNALVQALLAIVAAATAAPPRRAGGRMQQAVEYMEAHAGERLTIAAVAQAVGLSPSWLKARFRREVGMPPAEYLLRRKVDRAVELLANPRLSITRIALRLGFSSSQHFAAVIRRYTGASPSQLRLSP